jgi:hypothetical protein
LLRFSKASPSVSTRVLRCSFFSFSFFLRNSFSSLVSPDFRVKPVLEEWSSSVVTWSESCWGDRVIPRGRLTIVPFFLKFFAYHYYNNKSFWIYS